ncbi:hypothetical protein EVAR_37847_1 [Eumeta japonica]|uniref:Uncharacterized protein n=1 Tax=Eumeta variegata TaxID=151549 RepID=A0A4C1X076_EUMVA|nr:hypothetical protein EVAR_37847_1 [Eumeta japonica]
MDFKNGPNQTTSPNGSRSHEPGCPWYRRQSLALTRHFSGAAASSANVWPLRCVAACFTTTTRRWAPGPARYRVTALIPFTAPPPTTCAGDGIRAANHFIFICVAA